MIGAWLSQVCDSSITARHKEVEQVSRDLGERLGEWFQRHKDFCDWSKKKGRNLLVFHGLGTLPLSESD